jgi:imidazoleglycerol phosphate synthase glutamine amidotransferase subunit HisH
VGNKNLFAVQFHPEKSGRFGLQMLKRFAAWDGEVQSESGNRGK